jgi:Glycosyl transferases group 1.
VALEGMAAHVPVVTSDAGGLAEFVEHTVTGVTTYAGDSLV